MTRVVYTALIGGHEQLWEQPVAAGSAIDFVCLTDDPELRSDSWRIELVEPALPEDPVRSARLLKIEGHPSIAGYDESLWLDARVVLKVSPELILDDWLSGSDLTLPKHSFRPSVVAEFAEVIRLGIDDTARVHEQLNHYAVEGAERLQQPTPWTALLARRHGAEVERAMTEWMRHVWRYSRRDQLSFVEAVARAGVTPRLVDLPNLESALHEWPTGIGRDPREPAFRLAESLLAPVARVGILERELELMTYALSGSIDQRELQLQAQEVNNAELSDELTRLRAEGDELRAHADGLAVAVQEKDVLIAQLTRRVRRQQRRIKGLRAELTDRDERLARPWWRRR